MGTKKGTKVKVVSTRIRSSKVDVKISKHDYGGDISKSWFVLLTYYSPISKKTKVKAGVNRYKSKRERTKELNSLYQALINQIEQGQDFTNPEGPEGDGNLLDRLRLVLDQKKRELRPDSIKLYQTSLNHFYDWVTGRGYRHKNDIGKPQVEEFRTYLLDLGCAKTTINVYMSSVQALFENLDGVNPFLNFGKLRVNDRTKRHVPFRDDHWKILKTGLEQKYYPVLMLLQGLYYTGLRILELIALKRADLDLDHGRIYTMGANTKSGRTDTIRIPPRYLELLRNYLEGVPDEHFIFGGTITNLPHITQATRNQLSGKFIRVRGELGLDGYGYTIYSSRHKVACDLLDQGVSLKNISLFLRHNSLLVTEKYLRSMGRTVDDEVIQNFPEF